MGLKSDRDRVQSALLIYLLVFLGLNLYVWAGFALHRHGIHRFPLGERVERFGDLLRFSGKFQYGKDPHMNDPEHLIGTLFPLNYPAFPVVIYLFLLQVCAPYALAAMMLPVIAAICIACTMLWRRARRFEAYRGYMGVAIFATGLFGWGTEQVVMRGNIEGVLWIGTALGASLYAQRKFRGAAVAFAVAACIKPYPVLWLALMARHRKFKEVLLAALSACAVTLASLLAIDRNPIRAYDRITGHADFFGQYIAAFRPMEEMKGDHSLFQSIKTIARIVRNGSFSLPAEQYTFVQANSPLAHKLFLAYLPLAAAIGLMTLWKVWSKPVLNQVFAVALMSTLLPFVTGDYTLTVLLIPMGFLLIFLLQDAAVGRPSLSMGRLLWFLLPCAWVMATEPLNILHGVFKCLALLVLLAATVTVPLPSTLFGEVV